jgi:hypothetical protein
MFSNLQQEPKMTNYKAECKKLNALIHKAKESLERKYMKCKEIESKIAHHMKKYDSIENWEFPDGELDGLYLDLYEASQGIQELELLLEDEIHCPTSYSHRKA